MSAESIGVASSTPSNATSAAHPAAWHPSRLLVAEGWICVAAIAASGLLYLSSWLPRPAASPAVAAAIQRLKDPFSRDAGRAEAPVPLMQASRGLFAAIQQAEKLEDRGQFDEVTRRAWKRASDEVRRLGLLPIAVSGGGHVRLFMKEAEAARMEELAAVLEELLPGRFAALEAERLAAAEADPVAEATLPAVTWMAVAETAPESLQNTARNLAVMHDQAARNVVKIARCREHVGYDYWKATCAAAASGPGLEARAALWQADYGFQQAAFDRAKELYQEGLDLWREACGAVPELGTNPSVVTELHRHEQRYREVLSVLGAAGEAAAAADGSLDL